MQARDVSEGTAQVASDARSTADEAEALRTMPPALVDRVRRAGLFRMAMPAALGGLELEPAAIVAAVEEVSRADGSAGWTVLIGNSTGFLAWLEPTAAKAMLDGAVDVVSTSMFAPLGRARRDGDHLVIDGRWPFNSGCVHADWYQAGVMVMDDDGPAHRPDGTVDTRFATFPRQAAGIIDTWHSTGLRGTGSHDIEVRDLRIPEAHTAAPMLDPPVLAGGLWELGFFPLLAVLMSGFPLGVARRALDELTTLAPTKRRGASPTTIAEDSRVQYDLGRAEAAVQSARSFVYDVIGDAWDSITAGTTPSPEQLARITLASQQTMHAAVTAVDLAFGHAGAGIVYSGHPLERCFRDLHTANQHIAFSGDGFSAYARAQLSA
jgi:alkylation response protein AidB-like acyl-CoA dehydrogenase